MAIPDDDVAAVRSATDIVALVGEHQALKRQGRRWVGLCPFHTEKTPSFSVNAEEGLYYCFGCQASGDSISFVRAVEHLDFVGAVERLAERAGITLHQEDEGAGRERQKRRALQGAMEEAVAWYHERLLSAADAGPARDYLRSRGYDGEVVRAFKLGWAPDAWDALARQLKISDSAFRDSGLGFVNKMGRQQDGMRARVIFPIFDQSGKAVALGGRTLPGWRPAPADQRGPAPKYKNSPETVLYSKRRTLYGLNWAKSSVVDSGEAIVCEGYTDVIAFFRAGMPRAVATCGTALGEEHFRLLRNFARRIVLAYDSDTAGKAAAGRFYEWERRHELDIRVAAFPSGSDPAEVARANPDALIEAASGAPPFLEFRVERVMESANLKTPEGRVRAAEAALTVIAEHPNDLVRDQYLMAVADRCRLDPERLRPLLGQLRSGASANPVETAQMSSAGPQAGRAEKAGGREGTKSTAPRPHGSGNPGLEALRLAIHKPEEIADLLDEALFSDPVQRGAYRALASADTLHQAIDTADLEVAELLRRLAVEETDAESLDVVRLLGVQVGSAALSDLEAESRAPGGGDRFLELAPVTTWLRLAVEELRESDQSVESLHELVAWLTKRAQGDQSREGI